jgi:hypothetical protein
MTLKVLKQLETHASSSLGFCNYFLEILPKHQCLMHLIVLRWGMEIGDAIMTKYSKMKVSKQENSELKVKNPSQLVPRG